MRLGIDFGTTRTVVAAATDGRHPLATFDVEGAFVGHVPGVVATDAAGALHYGWDAVRVAAERPAAGIRSIKRVVSRLLPDEEVPGLGSSALDVTTGFLRHLRALVVERSNLGVRKKETLEAMVAVPANASSRQRFLTLEAFRRAGFDVLGMVNEPTAAAIEYAHRHLADIGKKSPKRYVVVYDLGGGTFDTSAVSLIDRSFDLLASEGIAELGGDDFDAALLSLALEATDRALDDVDPGLVPALLEAAREAKETLGPNAKRVLCDLSAVDAASAPVVLDTAALYARTAPLVDRTLDVLDRLLAELPNHGVDTEDPKKLAAIYLVGGSVAFPAVGKALRTRFARKLKLAPEPHAATALGLAIAADSESSVRVTEATTRCFGVWREADRGRDKVFDAIIERNTEVPTSGELIVERRYRPAHRVGHLRFMECTRLDSARQPLGDLIPSFDVRFPYDPSLASEKLDRQAHLGAERTDALEGELIVERYSYRRDGRISVVIRNDTRGYEQRFDQSAR